MSAIPPIEPPRPAQPLRRVERRRPDEEKESPQQGFQDDSREDDDPEDDGLPHIDVRA